MYISVLNLVPLSFLSGLFNRYRFYKFSEFILQTFLTLSLADMANRVQLSSPKEAEKYVLHMVGTHNFCRIIRICDESIIMGFIGIPLPFRLKMVKFLRQ